MKNEKLKTDGDIMVYLINVRRAVAELSKRTGKSIDLHAAPNGYARVKIGEYEALQLAGGRGKCEYQPSDVSLWKYISPSQVNFAGKPIEKPLEPASNQGLDNINAPSL